MKTARKTGFLAITWVVPASIASALMLAGCTGQDERANLCTGVEQDASRQFLQQVTDTSAIIKWRGNADAACLGTDINTLDQHVLAAGDGSHKEAKLTGLQPDTLYYYSLGAASVGRESQQFRTAPAPGNVPADGNTHIWLLGDSGTATEEFRGRSPHVGEALAVKQGFLSYNAEQGNNEPLDLLLLLGDNAYLQGTDAEWQGAFFDIYPEIISRTALWTTIGNHEMGVAPLDICLLFQAPGCEKGPVVMPLGGVSESSDPASYDSNGDGPDAGGLPYLDIFSLPSKGQAGGVPSGTEQYYSVDHGNVHIVSLDSQLSNRALAQREAMRDWLVDDLSRNTLDWTIVIFHHPPYSKGENHDSNLEQGEIDMRETFAPVFEDYGVDVVYSGHAHSYERSWYLNGHHGMSETFDARQHAELNHAGEPSLGQGEESYSQLSPSSGSDDKAVYTVAGSAGKADEEHPCRKGQLFGCTPEQWLMHPAHRKFDESIPGARRNGLARKGSVVLDITRTTLTSRFVDERGQVLDYFTITR
ncbi:MAG: metallophosphoesterase family protein [Halioglobus sp.]